jgi:uncharacterized protein (TIGR02147 family)
MQSKSRSGSGGGTPGKDPATFREFLEVELKRRLAKDRRYSLRRFAADLEIDSTALSRIIGGQRRMTLKTFERLAEKLALSAVQSDRYRTGLASETRRPKSKKIYTELSSYETAALATWIHTAILELPSLKDFSPNRQWMARRLGISAAETKNALKELELRGLIMMNADGTWVEKDSFFTTATPHQTSEQKADLQRQYLQKAIAALRDVDIKFRSQTGVTFAMKTSRLPYLIDTILKFQRRLAALAQEVADNDEVYQLSISLFPVTEAAMNDGNSNGGC